MNYWALADLVGSAVAAAFVAVLAMHTTDPNVTVGGYLAAAGSAFVAALIQHLRTSPAILPSTPPPA